MTAMKTSDYDHADLRPAIFSKGLKTFHLVDAEEDAAACGLALKDPTPAGTLTKRAALRRGLKFCGDCEALEAAEYSTAEAAGE